MEQQKKLFNKEIRKLNREQGYTYGTFVCDPELVEEYE